MTDRWHKPIHVLVFFVGLLGLAAAFGAWPLTKICGDRELPLGRFSSIAVDSSKNIYCVSEAYHRVQQYDENGTFLRAYAVGRKFFDLYIDDDKNVYAWDQGRWYYKYDSEAQLIAEGDDAKPPVSKEYDGRDVKEAVDGEGNIYRIARFSWVLPRVTRQSPSGERSVVVSQALYLWLIQWPFPALLFTTVAVVYGLIVHWRRKRRRQEERNRGSKLRRLRPLSP